MFSALQLYDVVLIVWKYKEIQNERKTTAYLNPQRSPVKKKNL